VVSGGESEQNDEKVDGRWCPSGEETRAFHHSFPSLRGLHPRPFLTGTAAVPFPPRPQPATRKGSRSLAIELPVSLSPKAGYDFMKPRTGREKTGRSVCAERAQRASVHYAPHEPFPSRRKQSRLPVALPFREGDALRLENPRRSRRLASLTSDDSLVRPCRLRCVSARNRADDE